MGESGRSLNTGAINRGDGADGSNSLGFGQWNGPRARNLQATAQAMGLGWNSGQAQVTHLFNELDGKYKDGNYSHVLDALKNANSVYDGTNIWTRNYEVPANADQQVQIRLAHAQALAQGAAQGTLDLSKIGSFDGGDQNMPNYRNFQAQAGQGALSPTGMTGDLGALYRFAQEQSQPTLGQRLAAAGAALASISSPSQASVIKGIVPQGQSNNSKLDAMIKALALRKQLQSTQQGNALSFQGLTKDGTPYYTDPNTGKVVDSNGQVIDAASMQKHSVAPDTNDGTTDNPKLVDQYNKATAAMQDAAQNKDEVLGLNKDLVTNPEIAKSLNATASMRTWMDNALGQAKPEDLWQKKFQSAVNNYVLLMQRITPGMRSDKGRQVELDSIAPNGAMNDPAAAQEVLNRMTNRLNTAYGSSLSAAQVLNGIAPKTFGNITGADGSPMPLNDYHTARTKSWKETQDQIDKALPDFLAAHAARSGQTKPVSRVDQILNWIGNQNNQ